MKSKYDFEASFYNFKCGKPFKIRTKKHDIYVPDLQNIEI